VSPSPPADRRVDPLVELCPRIRDGDVAAFEQLFRAMHAPLCEVADSYVRSQAIAEEIIQDLFFVLWMKRDRIPRPEAMRAYLFTAARNRALHHLRHRAVVRRWSARSESHPDVAGTAHHAVLPDDALQSQERSEALRRAIDQLAPRTRLAVVLRLDHGMSQDEVASAMGITIKGVEKLLAAAKAKLRALLGPHADTTEWDG
jgi:RNA polymerase sigma-70 factor (ECF subfamily)